MTVFFVSLHPGAFDWARRHRVAFDVSIPHIDQLQLTAGDTVIGSLPVNLAANVCATKAKYLHLVVQLPIGLRGQELTADQLDALGARLQEYIVSN